MSLVAFASAVDPGAPVATENPRIGGIVIASTASGDLTYTIDDNTTIGSRGSAIVTGKLAGLPNDGTAVGTIRRNAIGVAGVAASASELGSGIDASMIGGGRHSVQIVGNTIRGYRASGLYLQAGGGALAGAPNNGSLNDTVTGNTIAQRNPTSSTAHGGIQVNTGTTSQNGAAADAYQVCLDLNGNTITGSAAAATGRDLILRRRFERSSACPGTPARRTTPAAA